MCDIDQYSNDHRSATILITPMKPALLEGVKQYSGRCSEHLRSTPSAGFDTIVSIKGRAVRFSGWCRTTTSCLITPLRTRDEWDGLTPSLRPLLCAAADPLTSYPSYSHLQLAAGLSRWCHILLDDMRRPFWRKLTLEAHIHHMRNSLSPLACGPGSPEWSKC